MGGLMKDSTTYDILTQLNKRFEPGDAITEMTALHKEFKIFSPERNLRHSFAVLGIVPHDWNERKRWYNFLEHLRTYDSDLPDVNGHDRVLKAIEDNLESKDPLPVTIKCHAAEDDPRVVVTQGRPVIFSLQEHVVISIPTTPGREARSKAADTARQRRETRRQAGGQPKTPPKAGGKTNEP